MRKKRISIERKSRKIGFMGKGMSMPSRHTSEIGHALELRIDEDLISSSQSSLERYRYDSTPVQTVIGKIFSKRPTMIVYPDSSACLADVIDACIEEKTPAVPRGAGTLGLGGATPVRGGVVIDLTRMSQVLAIDKQDLTATVEAGCTWKALSDALAGEGLGLRCYPSSAPFSTVGGWMSTGGYGIGTLREGRFHEQVRTMEVALPSGLLVTSGSGEGRYDIGSFAGTEGQMGVIANLTVPVKQLPEREATYLVRLDDGGEATGLLRQLGSLEDPPMSATLIQSVTSTSPGDTAGSTGRWRTFIVVRSEGDAGRVARTGEAVRNTARSASLEVDAGDDASRAWERRFSYHVAEDGRPTCLAGEVLVGLDAIAPVLESIGAYAGTRRGMTFQCQVVSREHALVTVSYHGRDTGQTGFLRDIAMTNRIVDIGIRMGGRPYGLGIWNTGYAKAALGTEYKRLGRLKDEIDRLCILNPGKFFAMKTNAGLPVPAWLYRTLLGLTGAKSGVADPVLG